jgi:hypothetical protein
MSNQGEGCLQESHKSSMCVVLAVLVCILLSIFYPTDSSSSSSNDIPSFQVPKNLGENIKHNILFYAFFASWIFRFFPQISVNRSRNSTLGVSPDFTLWHLVANSCLTILFVTHAYYGYNNKLGFLGMSENPILANVFVFENIFSVLILGLQTIKLNGGWKMHKPSWPLLILITALAIITILGLLLIKFMFGSSVNFDNTFDTWLACLLYLFFLANIFRLIPQIQLNGVKKSTIGFSLAFSVLDFTGAAAILAKLILKDINVLMDWLNGTPTSTEFAQLAFMAMCIIVMFLDIVLIFQGLSLKNKEGGYISSSSLQTSLILQEGADPAAIGTDDVELEAALRNSERDAHFYLEEKGTRVAMPTNHSQSWNCIRCTFVNDFSKDQCEVCRLPQEKSIQPGSRTQDEAMLFNK